PPPLPSPSLVRSLASGSSKLQMSPAAKLRSDWQRMLGAIVSCGVIVWTQLARLPQPSVAVHVRRMALLPVQLVAPGLSTKLTLATPLQLSVAVATPVLSVVVGRLHSRVILAGQVITGGFMSLKLIVW